MKLGKRIRAARDKVDMSQAELAAKVGVSVSTVCGWETEAHGLEIRRLPAIAKALGVDVAELVA